MFAYDDTFRGPGEPSRLFTREDYLKLSFLLRVITNAALPPNNNMMTSLSFQEDAHKLPARYELMCMNLSTGTSYDKAPQKHIRELHHLIGRTLLEKFPLHIFRGTSDCGRESMPLPELTSPKEPSAHQRIESLILARQVFGDDSPLILYLQRKSGRNEILHDIPV